MNKLTIVLIVLMATACETSKDNNVDQSTIETLPYYEEATFTPQWFSSREEMPEKFHHIPKFSVVNQLGDAITEEVFDNKISIVNFFFTTCPGICPKMMANMDLVQKQLREKKQLQLLSYSVTPEMDGVSELKEYAEKNEIPSEGWYLLTGNREVIYDLGRNQFFVEEDMGLEKRPDDFLHTENILLIDGERHIRGIYNGLNKTAINQMIADVETLQAEMLAH